MNYPVGRRHTLCEFQFLTALFLSLGGLGVRGSGRCEGIRFIRNGGSQPHIQYLPFVIGVRFDSSSKKITKYEGQQRDVIFEVKIPGSFVCRTAIFISFVNLLAPVLFFLILAHPVYKM